MSESKYVKKMKSITKEVSTYRQIIKSEHPGFQTLDGGKKKVAIVKHIYTSERAAVAGFYAETGSVFPSHNHDETEFFIVTEGEVVVDAGGKIFELGIAGTLRIEPKVPHQVTVIKDTFMLVVTIPAAKDFPHE